MENYISEIVDICKLPFDEVMKDYKVISIGGKALYISNYKKILDYSKDRIALKIPSNTLEIEGEDMCIRQINKGEIVISGKIISFGLGVKNNEKK